VSPETDQFSVTLLVVRRWARYGQQRLYVQAEGGTSLGHWDVVRECLVVDDAALRPTVLAALRKYAAEAGVRLALPSDELVLAPAAAAVPEQRVASAEVAAAPEAVTVGSGVPTPVAPTPAAVASVVSWSDLAGNRPGQAAREQAVAHREAAPVRTFAARVLRVHTDERAWRIGADAEEFVGKRLDELEGWRVLHAVLVGDRGSDIDHVAIGPGGVFTINTKHHPDARVWVRGDSFLVDGHRQPYVRNSRHEAQRASRLLTDACGFGVTARGVVALRGGAGGFTVKQQPDDVRVVGSRELARWLRKLPPVLEGEAVELIYAAARRSTTWLRPRQGEA
jgi:hypothetical protein